MTQIEKIKNRTFYNNNLLTVDIFLWQNSLSTVDKDDYHHFDSFTERFAKVRVIYKGK